MGCTSHVCITSDQHVPPAEFEYLSSTQNQRQMNANLHQTEEEQRRGAEDDAPDVSIRSCKGRLCKHGRLKVDSRLLPDGPQIRGKVKVLMDYQRSCDAIFIHVRGAATRIALVVRGEGQVQRLERCFMQVGQMLVTELFAGARLRW